MPWSDPQTIPLTRIDIVSQVPSASGVYAIYDGELCLLVGEAWNLKARLLELMNILQDIGEFRVVYDLCEEAERVAYKDKLTADLLRTDSQAERRAPELPGISFRNSIQN
jgi:hypothetical protein